MIKKENNLKENEQLNETHQDTYIMPVVALRGIVVMPSMVINFDVAREKSIKAIEKAMTKNRKIFLVAQKDIMVEEPQEKDLYKIGVIAEIKQTLKTQGEGQRVVVEGLVRAKLDTIIPREDYIQGIISEYPLKTINKEKVFEKALMRKTKKAFEDYFLLSPKMPKELIINIMNNEDPVSF
ncbi:MAG: LON peptidase substrate-binding domain-containing protein, partial [Oscillospiraceae bacterium]